MGMRDRAIGWNYRRIWIPIRVFAGFDNDGSSDISLSAGTPTLEPISTAEVAGLPMTTADEIGHWFPLPWDMDYNKKVYGRIFFQHAAAGADVPEFIWTSKFFAKQEAISEFIAGADKSTSFAAHTCSTTNPSLEVTVWTDLSWESYISSTDIFAAISIELNALGSASADECKLLGVEIGYEVAAAKSPHRKTSSAMGNENPLR